MSVIALKISDLKRHEIEELKVLMKRKKKSKDLDYMFNNIDRFLDFFSFGNMVCIYYDSNGFNGFVKEDVYYCDNKEFVDFVVYKKILE